METTTKTTKQKRQELRKQLKQGDISLIANAANLNTETVSRYFKGESDNAEVAKCTKQLLEERSKRREQRIKQALE